MAANSRIFTGETLDLGVGEMSAESRVQLAWEVVVEFGEKLDVEEEHRRGGEFVGHDIEENLRAVVLVLLGGALLGSDGHEPHFDEIGSVSKEESLPPCSRLD